MGTEATNGHVSTEVRLTSSTGARKGQKPERFDLIPVGPLTALARHYGVGAEKYTERDGDGSVTHDGGDNWRLGYDWRLSFAACNRHLWAFWGGEDIDTETGSSHLIAAAWHLFTLFEFTQTHREFDTRRVTVEQRARREATRGSTDGGQPQP
jgi:hypothetical protein